MAVNIKKIGSEELEKQKKYCQKVSSLLEKRYKNQDKPAVSKMLPTASISRACLRRWDTALPRTELRQNL